MIKFFCDMDGLKDNWIGITERWTQRESKAINEAMNEGWSSYLPVLASKVEGCSLTVGDVVITDFADVDEEVIDQMDLRMVGFLGGILQTAILRLRSLGNASARVLSSPPDGKR